MFEDAVEQVLAQRRMERRQSSYYNSPVLWAKERAGVFLWSKQREVLGSVVENHDTVVKAGHGVGKAVSNNTPLPTPTGWIKAGDVAPGTTLLSEAGTPTTVTGLSPVWDRPEYRITFDDGTTVLAGPEHEWTAIDLTRRSRAAGTKDWRDMWHTAVTAETQEMAASLKTNANQNRWKIPVATPLQAPEADLPIDPYLLGFWLGDGSAATKEGVFDWLDNNGYEYGRNQHATYSVATVYGLKTELRDLGVLNNKHIPMEYLRASESQRRALLAGLMDADGFMMTGSEVGIDLTHERLSSDLYELLMTLGCKVFRKEAEAAYTKNGERHVTGTRYRFNWRPAANPFLNRRAGWVSNPSQASRHTARTIVSIELTGERIKNFCIEVDSESHLYLAGEQWVPTHNSYLSALAICWWMDTRWPLGRVASTAPSLHQVESIIWFEVRNIIAKVNDRYTQGLTFAPMPGRLTSTNGVQQWKTMDGRPLGMGRKPPDNKEEDAFQGIHAEGGVLAIGDEAVGLSEGMIDALGNITSTESSRRLLICNPTNPASYVGKIFRENFSNWTKFTISVFDGPNFTGEDVPDEVAKSLTDASYVVSKKAEYGEGTPRYLSRVLGEFAFDNDFSLITQEDLAVAHDTEIEPSGNRPVLGVDLSRFGDDFSVIYSNDGGRIRHYKSWSKADGVQSARNIHEAALATGASEVRIDNNGLGAPIIDIVVNLREDVGADYDIVRMNGSESRVPDVAAHANARAWWYDSLRYGLQTKKFDLQFEDDKLTDELMGIQYKFGRREALLIESKKDMRSRGVKSPDLADAVVYATAPLDILEGIQPGDVMRFDPEEFTMDEYGSPELNVLPW